MNDAALNLLSDELLADIRRKPSRYHTLEKLADTHHCRKSDILFSVDILRRTGYEIKSDTRDRLCFVSAPDLLLAAEITHRLKTAFVGQTVYAYNSVQSTNTAASKLAGANAPNGAIVVAESQTLGRGRLSRPWFSIEGAGIYLSIILYPDIEPIECPGLSIVTALALAETMAAYGSMKVEIKWPNDCLLNGRKAAGILTELSADMTNIEFVIVGIGININHRRRDFPAEMKKTATSIRAEAKKSIRRIDFLQKFLKLFERDYNRFCRSGLKPFRRRILAASSMLGKKIKLDMQGKIITGKAVDIDPHGSLVLETAEGRQSFCAGDVTVVKQ